MQEIEGIPNPIRLLIIDDDREDIFLIKRFIAAIEDSDFVVDSVENFDEACEKIFERKHDVYLVDYRLGEKTGLDLLRIVKPSKRSEPFIMMSGADDRDLLRASMQFAAADSLMKGTLGSEVLSKTILYALQRKHFERQRVEHLEELNRSKDEFISISSHQLRTPATGVKQYLGMVLEGFLGSVPPEQKAMLEKAYESNERQLRIVSDLLRVAQVDAGKVVLHKQETDVGQLLNDVITGLKSVFSERSQTLTLDIDCDAPMALIDIQTVRMVCENIIENASKYSEAGVTIQVEVTCDDEFVIVRVIDEGVGIAQEDQGKLFAKFTRIDNVLSTKVGGTGLGLYWAKKIMDTHSGEITYKSNKPKGSIFTIKLPKQ